MMYEIFYGEISEKRKELWDNGDDNPFKILEWRKELRILDFISFFHLTKRYLKDEIKIDWGSFAWKGSKEEILRLVREVHGELEDESVLQDGVEYGVVFIEMY